MDAQNVREPKSAPERGVTVSAKSKRPTTAAIDTTFTVASGDRGDHRSLAQEPKSAIVAAGPLSDAALPEQDSEAETIVLPGKVTGSPWGSRKLIKHEDRSEGEVDDDLPPPTKPLPSMKETRDGESSLASRPPIDGVRKRREKDSTKRPQQRSKDGTAGSRSTSNSPHHHRDCRASSTPRHQQFADTRSGSDNDMSQFRSPLETKVNGQERDHVNSSDRLVSQRRRAPKTESDEEDVHKGRRPRMSEPSIVASMPSKSYRDYADHNQKPESGMLHHEKHSTPSRMRSVSPHARSHRSSQSTQLPNQQASNGLGVKKKRIPAPLQAADYRSDDSSASGSAHARSSRLKSMVTPVTGESTSPPKFPPHKKHLDAHGQTLFAKACAKGEYEVAKMRLQERPEDLNYADHAGNTPLQVASLNGHEDVVRLLIQAGCDLECRNNDKDTPLIDAVENANLGVVRLLLEAGVNPRKPNAEGQEPLELINDDVEDADEIRNALVGARQRLGERRRTSEDQPTQDTRDDLSPHGADSPRRSSVPSTSGNLGASSRRGGTVRSTKTSNHLLYMNLDEKTLRSAAAKGDTETVTRVLQVKEGSICDDPEALVAAARGGHNVVMELLLAIGGGNPDPSPINDLPKEHSTPILAAIGGENIKCIQLLLSQPGFDPTRRFRGHTYYELARLREGPVWKEEEDILKTSYDEYRKSLKGKTTISPTRRERDHDRKSDGGLDGSRPHKPPSTSTPTDADPRRRSLCSKMTISPKEATEANASPHTLSDQVDRTPSRRCSSARSRKAERGPSTVASDREASPATPAKSQPSMSKAAESEMATITDGETVRPVRKRLMSAKDIKGQREQQRRASMASNVSNAKDGSDKNEGKHEDEGHVKPRPVASEKYHDRRKALRDDSSAGDRQRSSLTPPRHGSGGRDDENVARAKRRKLDGDGREVSLRRHSSPEERARKRALSQESAKLSKPHEKDEKNGTKAKKAGRDRSQSDKSSPADKGSITVYSQDRDIPMRDVPRDAQRRESRHLQARREQTETRKRQTEADAAAAEDARRNHEDKRCEDEVRRKREEQGRRTREAEGRRLKEEAEKKRRDEEEKQRREEEERKRRQEAERAKAEELRRRREEEEQRRQKEEEDRRWREEADRVQREREAAEEAHRRMRAEEEERKRQQAALEAEQARERQEKERLRVARLPPLLRWLDQCPNPKQRDYAELFTIVQGVRYDTINPAATGKPGGRDQWLLNTQVALLLGDKDLSLSSYERFGEKVAVSNIAKRIIWRVEQDRYALTEGKLYHLGKQLPDYYGGDPHRVGYKKLEALRGVAAKLFLELDMFFVKESEFLFILRDFPHLRNVKLSISYRELPEDESALKVWSAPSKWKTDPEAGQYEGYAPRHKYYINGQLVAEDRPGHYKPSRSPFPERRVPRRGGLVAVGPEEPDYARLCMEQGLGHLLSEQQRASVMPGLHLTPRSMTSNGTSEPTNGDDALSPDAAEPTTRVNGFHPHGPDETPAVNGMHGRVFRGP